MIDERGMMVPTCCEFQDVRSTLYSTWMIAFILRLYLYYRPEEKMKLCKHSRCSRWVNLLIHEAKILKTDISHDFMCYIFMISLSIHSLIILLLDDNQWHNIPACRKYLDNYENCMLMFARVQMTVWAAWPRWCLIKS